MNPIASHGELVLEMSISHLALGLVGDPRLWTLSTNSTFVCNSSIHQNVFGDRQTSFEWPVVSEPIFENHRPQTGLKIIRLILLADDAHLETKRTARVSQVGVSDSADLQIGGSLSSVITFAL
jgi:hypothetical protein